ncbi:hypothetical protein HNO53_17350 [Billgrantia antri]|uniref:Uncharacterized protein n=1 Tax=Halomonas sulfidivorans TaxID=2733488 RepID=A0ABX7WJI7_9GAMM|nr:hypothetical protein [Halomonas sulfidivorans]QTP60324.1 hypothetical protein HNO53_17350 [Halomonas sulfidivorans]
MNNFSKKGLAAILAAGVLLWLSTFILIPWAAQRLAELSAYCNGDILTDRCYQSLVIYGSIGDMFGATAALFSGLALFAVAATLWIDINARREGRKPLVISMLDQESILFKNPSIKNGRELTISISLALSNQTEEAAINVMTYGQLVSEGSTETFGPSHLQAPIIKGPSESITIEKTINGHNLDKFLTKLTEQGCIFLELITSYESLENVKWSTRTTYILTSNDTTSTKRLNAIRSGITEDEDFEVLWGNKAAASLTSDVKEGSWRHQREE